MTLNYQAREFLDMMAELDGPPVDAQTPTEARAQRAALGSEPTETCHEIRDLNAGGVPARLYTPHTPPRRSATGGSSPDIPSTLLGLLVYFHGGGWVIGDLESHDNVCRALANRSGHAVLSVDYRLAPEHPFPAGLGDCVQALRWAHANAAELGVDPDRISVGGDSSGANYATVICHIAPIPIVFQLLVYPVTDCRMQGASYEENAEGYFLTRSSMRWFVDHYLSGEQGAIDDPRVSPLLASDEMLARCPRTLVITAGFDPLRDEGIDYVHRLAAAGVHVSHVHFPGQFHAFFSLPHILDDANAALAVAAEALSNPLNNPLNNAVAIGV